MKFFKVASSITFLLPLVITLSISQPSHSQNTCHELFKKTPFQITAELKPDLARHPTQPRANTFGNSERFKKFEDLAKRIKKDEDAFRTILMQIENRTGADYEIEQVIRTLRGVSIHEGSYLNNIGSIENVAVYGSTNIPLYTLILHAVIPASTGANVWFRTPQLTRPVYVSLFEALKRSYPDFAWERIHLLTEKRDVQYENFRKLHVLGLNLNGTRFLRKPSEVVLFTGSPKTGDEILAANKRKLEELVKTESGQNLITRQIFLKFGSGLNPVVITQHATGQLLDQAVAGTITAVRINASQDCIAPKVYFVHSSAKKRYFEQLQQQLAGLKFSPNTDLPNEYGPISFTEDFTALRAFRDKWAAYLVNPDAVLNPETKQVDPHLFIVPFSKFKELDLVDHFAPFLVHVTFDHDHELKQVATDARIRERAMFASLYGQSSNTDMVATRRIFEESFHTTIMNQSIFTEESGNFPFGGYSPDASSVTHISIKNQFVADYTEARPLLFSKEAARAFPRLKLMESEGRKLPSAQEIQYSQNVIRDLLEQNISPSSGKPISPEWKTLKSPQWSRRTRGLSDLRKVIANEGLFVFKNQSVQNPKKGPSEKEILRDSDRTIYKNFTPSGYQPGKGVVIHPSYIGQSVDSLNQVRGRLNPHLGVGYLHNIFFSSKEVEYHLANAVMPGSMPRSLSYQQALTIAEGTNGIESARQSMQNAIIQYIQLPRRPNQKDQAELTATLELGLRDLFAAMNVIFPEGAFVKNYGEFTTGDLGNQITTFAQNERMLVTQFVEKVNQLKSKLNPEGKVTFRPLLDEVKSAFYETGFKFITQLIIEPKGLLFQERLKIAKTKLGLPIEVRVDFIDGEAVLARPRYTTEYLRPEMDEAMTFLNQFFQRAPEAVRFLSGGADVVKSENGRWYFMEFNFGSNSGSIQPQLFPIEANLFISRLQGKPTPLVKKLEDTYFAGNTAQAAFLNSLKVGREAWMKPTIDQLSIAEVAKYFRDRALDQFRKRPSRFHAQITIQNLSQVFAQVENQDVQNELQLLLRGANDFIARYPFQD